MTTVLSFGPFLPAGEEPPGTVDLGIRLRERELRGHRISGAVRQGLKERLAHALEHEQHGLAGRLLSALLDTWPVAAMVEEAVASWRLGHDGHALPVLVQAAELLRLANGWGRLDGTPWPAPDAGWIRRQVAGVEAPVLRRRHHLDGAEQVAEALGVPVQEGQPLLLPPVAEVAGPDLALRRAELCRALARGELAAVQVTSPVPPDPASQLALGELRLEGAAQAALEAYGLAGLVCGQAATWREVVGRAPAGRVGPRLVATCDAALLPGTPFRLAQGDTDTVGWLLWNAPFAPVAVHPVAVHVLRALDGQRDAAGVAAAVDGPAGEVAQVLDELVRVGAATAS